MPAAKPQPGEQIAERRYRRHAVEVEVSLTSESNFYMGFTENISEGGLFIATYDFAPMGADVEFELRLPGMSESVTCRGGVKWVREYNPDCTDVMPGMGIMFKDMDPKTEAVIKHFVRSRDALFYDEF